MQAASGCGRKTRAGWKSGCAVDVQRGGMGVWTRAGWSTVLPAAWSICGIFSQACGSIFGKRDRKGGSHRVNRGGSWNNNPGNVRAANRNRNEPGNRNSNLGFRLVSTGKGRNRYGQG